jgi:hypothetical protein
MDDAIVESNASIVAKNKFRQCAIIAELYQYRAAIRGIHRLGRLIILGLRADGHLLALASFHLSPVLRLR